jgi:polysaccharide transporter, PST family
VERPLGVSAARGIAILVSRTLGLQLLTVGVTLVLARLLSPADYGLFAIATAVQAVAQAASGIGLSTAMIREPEEPSPEQQRAVTGFLLLTGLGFAAVAAAIAFAPGLGIESEPLEVVAVAAVAVPLYAFRTVPMVLLERDLRFGRVAGVETAETLSFNAFALSGALAGFGAYSLVGAVPVAAAAGALVARRMRIAAAGLSLDLDAVRPLARFGLRASVLRMATLARELGFVVLLNAIGGAATAGFYAMAARLFSFPTALASAVQRVSFPALARAEEERPQRATRAAVLTAVAASLPLAAIAGASHAIVTVLLGDRWLPTVDIVLIGSAGMLLSASASPAMVGLALSQGRSRGPIAAVGASALAMGAACLVLVDPLGAAGTGIALTTSAVTAVAVLALYTEREMRGAVPGVGRALAIGAVAAVAGYLAPLPETAIGLALRLALVAAVWAALGSWAMRSDMRDALRMARSVLPSGLRGLVARGRGRATRISA